MSKKEYNRHGDFCRSFIAGICTGGGLAIFQLVWRLPAAQFGTLAFLAVMIIASAVLIALD